MAVQTPAECAANVRAAKYENLYLFYGRDTGALDLVYAEKGHLAAADPRSRRM